MNEEQLLQTHTCFYEDCFILSIKILIDSEVLQLQGHAQSLSLYCPHLNISFSPQNLREATTHSCQEHGAHFVGRMKCGDFPLFEVDFVSNKTLQSFLLAMSDGRLQSSIEDNLVRYIDVSSLRPRRASLPQLSVSLVLYLLNPNIACKDPILRRVTLENYQDCVSLFRKGQNFDYGALIRIDHKNRCRESPDLAVLVNELREVVNWATLGLNLKIPFYELRRIQSRHGLKLDGLLEMLDTWLKSGHATWISLIQALKKSGLHSLAQRLSITYGIPSLESPTHACNKKLECDGIDYPMQDRPTLSPNVEDIDREYFRNEERVALAKTRERKLSTSLIDIKENLQEVTEKLGQLTSRQQKLNNSLEKKQRHHSYLLKQSDESSDLKEMIEDIEETIAEAQEQISAVEEEMNKCRVQEKELRKELLHKEKELNCLKETIYKMKSANSKLKAEMDAERRIYDFKIRAMLAKEESEQKLQEELRRQVSFLENELVHRRNEVEQKLMCHPQVTLDDLKTVVTHLGHQLVQAAKTTQPAAVPKLPPRSSHLMDDSTTAPPPLPPRPFTKAVSSPQILRPHSSPSVAHDNKSLRFSKAYSYDGNDKNSPLLRLLDSRGLSWYYKGIDEQDAERLLTSCVSFTEGTFLVRELSDQSNPSQLYLSVLGIDQVNHYPIYIDSKLSFYYLRKEHKFCTLELLITHYKGTSEILPHCLTRPCSMLSLINIRSDIKVCKLFLEEQLVDGSYSQVYSGILMDKHQLVVAKAKKQDSTLSDYHFLMEAILLKALQHNCIHQFIGVTVLNTDQLCILSEPVLNISLKDHLERKRGRLGLRDFLAMVIQVAKGMLYLEKRKCIFRNLAAKNIIVTVNNSVKISNFSRACYSPSGKLHCKSKLNVLLRWTAPELLFDKVCSSKSDVWSFGVTFWEILTYGSKPYGEFSSEKVKEIVKSGYRIPIDQLYLPKKIHNMILDCWKERPRDRPTFKSLLDTLILIQDGYQ